MSPPQATQMTAKEGQYFDLAAEDEVLNPIGAELTAEEDGAALAQQGLLKTTKTERAAWCTQQGADNIWQHQWTGEQLDNGLIRKSISHLNRACENQNHVIGLLCGKTAHGLPKCQTRLFKGQHRTT